MKIPLLKFISRNYNTVILLMVLCIASFFRLYRIADYLTFLGDEGRDVLIVYGILHGDLTLLGPTASVGGFFLGPIYYYFMAPFLWLFNYSPTGPAVMVAIFGIGTVFLIYKIGKEFFSSSVGLIASGLYAISPLVVIYSRSSWNPNLMPFFSLFTLYILYKALSKNSLKLFILCGFLLGIAMQLHYLTLFLGAIVVFYVILVRRSVHKSLKDYLQIFTGFIIGWSPFLAFEIRHGLTNTLSIFNFIFRSGETGGSSHFFKIVNDVFFRLFGRLITNFSIPDKIDITLWYYFTLFLGITSVSVLVFKSIRAYREHSSDYSKFSLILIWLILGIALFGFYKKPIYDYYFGFMFPLPFFIVGIFLVSLWRNMFGKAIAILILLFIVWLNYLGAPYKASANRQLNQAETISRFVIDKTDNKPFNFAIITGGNSDHAYRYFFRIWNKDPVVIQNVEKDPQRTSVTAQLLVVCEEALCGPLGHSLWEIAGFGRAEIVGEWNVSVVKVYKLEHYIGKN